MNDSFAVPDWPMSLPTRIFSGLVLWSSLAAFTLLGLLFCDTLRHMQGQAQGQGPDFQQQEQQQGPGGQ